jgi:hypothetical protein
MKRWLESTFPGGKWQSGGDYLISSPLREDRHPSFAIHPEKRVWHDYATGGHGLLSELCKTLGIEEPGREGRAKALLIPPVDPEARQLWEKGIPASAHAYAERKGFPLDGLRVNPENGELLIPQRDPHTGEVVGVERISAHTDKDGKTPKFQTGKRGGIFQIGSTDGEQPILLSEGLSTGRQDGAYSSPLVLLSLPLCFRPSDTCILGGKSPLHRIMTRQDVTTPKKRRLLVLRSLNSRQAHRKKTTG